MRSQGAVVREQGVSFAVVMVKKQVVHDRLRATETIGSLLLAFPRLPSLVLVL